MKILTSRYFGALAGRQPAGQRAGGAQIRISCGSGASCATAVTAPITVDRYLRNPGVKIHHHAIPRRGGQGRAICPRGSFPAATPDREPLDGAPTNASLSRPETASLAQ